MPREECGANWLHLRGEDLGHSDRSLAVSQRVHFVAEGDEVALSKMREVTWCGACHLFPN